MSQVEKKRGNGWLSIFLQEDWWAVWLGFIIITGAALGKLNSPVLPGRWGREGAESIFSSVPPGIIIGIILTGIIALILFGISTFASCKKEIRSYVIGFPIVFLIAVLAELLGNYAPLRHYGMNNVIWALALGL
ncbi:MAG: putative sulfate exporter family transporter, partial [Clostridiales bacterium]|nr:putative sulfate exporter family transporter [Clostridiales bacterium]